MVLIKVHLSRLIDLATGVTTCAADGRTRKTIRVAQGESYTFNTNSDDEYGADVRCTVNYKKTGSCNRLRILCNQFDLGNGDILRVIRGGNKRT